MTDSRHLGEFTDILLGQSGGFPELTAYQQQNARLRIRLRKCFMVFFLPNSVQRATRCSATVQFTVYHVFLRGLSRHQSCSTSEWR